MRHRLLCCGILLLSGCSDGLWPQAPDAAVIDQIEAKLAKVRCVGPMNKWERHYSFASTQSLLAQVVSFGQQRRWFDYRKIKIDYYQAGRYGFQSRRILFKGAEPSGIDDRQFDLVFGDYDIPTHTTVIWACGPNMSEDGPVDLHIVVR